MTRTVFTRAAAAAALAVGALAVGAPAQASAPPGCPLYKNFAEGGTATAPVLVASIYYLCPAGGEPAGPIYIDRLVGGVSTVVASGYNSIEYTCAGTATTNTYTSNAGGSFTLACG